MSSRKASLASTSAPSLSEHGDPGAERPGRVLDEHELLAHQPVLVLRAQPLELMLLGHDPVEELRERRHQLPRHEHVLAREEPTLGCSPTSAVVVRTGRYAAPLGRRHQAPRAVRSTPRSRAHP